MEIGKRLERSQSTSTRDYTGTSVVDARSQGQDQRHTVGEGITKADYNYLENQGSRTQAGARVKSGGSVASDKTATTNTVVGAAGVTGVLGGGLPGSGDGGSGISPIRLRADASASINASSARSSVTDSGTISSDIASGTDGSAVTRSGGAGARATRDRSVNDTSGTFSSETHTSSTNSGHELSREERESLTRQKAEHERRAMTLDRIYSSARDNDWRITENLIPLLQPEYERMRMDELDRNLPHIAAVNISEVQRSARADAIVEIISGMTNERMSGFVNEHGLGRELPAAGAGRSSGFGGPGASPEPFRQEAGTAEPLRVSLKEGVNISQLDPRMERAIGVVAREAARLGLPSTEVTSAADSRHADGSKHYTGEALDFRGNNISASQGRAWASAVQSSLGDGYYAQFETFDRNPSNNHLHLQTRRQRAS